MSQAAGTMTPAMRREHRAFTQGKRAAADLIRALSVPDRAAQLAVARVLVDARKRANAAIERAKASEYGQEERP